MRTVRAIVTKDLPSDPSSQRRERSNKHPDPGRDAGDERQERLAAALRENLKRRKAQLRGRGPGQDTNR